MAQQESPGSLKSQVPYPVFPKRKLLSPYFMLARYCVRWVFVIFQGETEAQGDAAASLSPFPNWKLGVTAGPQRQGLWRQG